MNLVIGAGEVGSAVAEVLGCEARDVSGHQTERVGTLHICFPYSDDFTKQVNGYRACYQPEIVVIHSTVPVGTSRNLDACHSPVRGRHPHLAESLTTFTKFFAGKGATEAAAAWPGPVEEVPDPETTEAGKLWELLQFGLAVAQQKEMYRWCEANGADPDIAYRAFAESYNRGYQAMGEPHVTRPVIHPQPGRIGGHCVTRNAALIDHPFADLLLELDAQW